MGKSECSQLALPFEQGCHIFEVVPSLLFVVSLEQKKIQYPHLRLWLHAPTLNSNKVT